MSYQKGDYVILSGKENPDGVLATYEKQLPYYPYDIICNDIDRSGVYYCRYSTVRKATDTEIAQYLLEEL